MSEQGLIFGAAYESAAVISDGTKPEVNDSPITQYIASAHPGCRAPHVWLWRDGEKISAIDVFGPHFVLLAGPEGQGWRDAAAVLAAPDRPRLLAYTIGNELVDRDGVWLEAYGVEPDGALLVRPDGHVARRSRRSSGDPTAVLSAAFASIMGL